MQTTTSLTNNDLAFIALCNEYCSAAENAMQSDKTEFVANMVRLLPRIYISANDLKTDADLTEEAYIDSALDEDSYESVRRDVETVMGASDTYLEVFEEDMKYSDTPIAASVAEGIADIFQVLYNFVETIREAPTDTIAAALAAVKEDFDNYWSRVLCNVMRPLNAAHHNPDEDI